MLIYQAHTTAETYIDYLLMYSFDISLRRFSIMAKVNEQANNDKKANIDETFFRSL